MTVTRTVRGKRPEMFEAPGVDYLMSMMMTLASDFAVMRDRMDTLERIAASKGVILDEEIEAFEPDQDALEAREAWRQAFFDRLFFVFHQEVSELNEGASSEKVKETIDKIAVGALDK